MSDTYGIPFPAEVRFGEPEVDFDGFMDFGRVVRSSWLEIVKTGSKILDAILSEPDQTELIRSLPDALSAYAIRNAMSMGGIMRQHLEPHSMRGLLVTLALYNRFADSPIDSDDEPVEGDSIISYEDTVIVAAALRHTDVADPLNSRLGGVVFGLLHGPPKDYPPEHRLAVGVGALKAVTVLSAYQAATTAGTN